VPGDPGPGSGITYINGPTIGAEVGLPFGGVKETGNGHRESGSTVYDMFTEWKSVYTSITAENCRRRKLIPSRGISSIRRDGPHRGGRGGVMSGNKPQMKMHLMRPDAIDAPGALETGKGLEFFSSPF
jgi:hypothetical protein